VLILVFPCKEMAPVLKGLNEELQGKAIIKFVIAIDLRVIKNSR